MEKSSSRVFSLLIIPALMLTVACASSGSRRVARTTPQGPVATPAGPAKTSAADSAHSADAQPAPDNSKGSARGSNLSRPSDDPVDAVLSNAQEEYDQGVESLRAGETEEARGHFDAAIQVFMNSSVPVDQSPRLKAAFDKMVDDIATLESDLEEAPGSAPDATPSPTEGLDDIHTYLSPEEAAKERENVAPEAQAISFDIPIVINDQVLAWVEIFKNRKEFRQSFVGGYQRYGWYEEMIHRTFKEEGLPADLIYMAFLESTYKTSAYSRARARGIWQFMTPTGREYGLKVNRYVDERSNPEKSTRAAARYMKDLYATLGDWHLAIAAYNTGAGNILRAQRRSGKTDYWDLTKTRYMRTETKNFVPAILALALISKDPVKYGFEGVEHNPTLQYDRVTVQGPTDISLMARLAGCNTDDLKFLNPQLRLGVTPPGEKDYEVLLPYGRGEAFVAAYESLPDSEKIARIAKVHTVRRGDTLGSIAAKYGTSVDQLRASNKIGNPRSLSIGAQLTVPGYANTVAVDDDAPRSRRSSRSSQVGTKYSPYHVVRRGDTLSGISRAYGISLRNLLSWNGMTESSVIVPGKRLMVGRGPSSSGSVRPLGAPRPDASNPPAAGLVSVPGGGQVPPDPAGEKIVYKVRAGDNLFRIALKFKTTVDDLKAWNSIIGDGIHAGDALTIYPN